MSLTEQIAAVMEALGKNKQPVFAFFVIDGSSGSKDKVRVQRMAIPKIGGFDGGDQ